MKNNILGFVFLTTSFIVASCDKYFDVAVDSSRVMSDQAFGDDLNATAAVNGIYQNMVVSSFAGGGSEGIAALTGLSADELNNVMLSESYMAFEQNRLLSDNEFVLRLWKGAYEVIFQANDAIDELSASTGISDSVRRQLTGEALFVRAFCNFYLVNLFSGVPIVTSGDYRVNAMLPRSTPAAVYEHIITDLMRAQGLLKDQYVDVSRTRPGRLAATALLARTYFFLGQWDNAIAQASDVIDDSQLEIVPDLNSVFLSSSRETIWQLASEQGVNTRDASAFIIQYAPSSGNEAISQSLLASFEEGDSRRDTWVGSFLDELNGLEIYFPYKYKAPFYGTTSEFYITFRLAEQLLIRAEAYARRENYVLALADLNQIRIRAGLDELLLENINVSEGELLTLIEHEKRIELFSEWGHRWLDLKRTGRAGLVLGVKNGWTDDASLYPIPEDEFNKNPNLGLQNDGY